MDRRRKDDDHFGLPTTLVGRAALAACCITFGFPATAFLYALLFRAPRPVGFDATMFRILVESLLLWLSVFCALGVTWAICRSERIELLLRSAVRKLTFAICWFCLFSVPFVFWTLWQV